ncbi:DUF6318 family protein [Pseudarthrobacter sp. J64]|uniref:DUF6318 family protein n=1 Tax=Pseudarthrobacter sp. J64 TaxID=3116485 RepID=UPI002E8221E2|nr:DUF6318 family protein [Pseudarthrobacter sp. J64]MEE2570708.1 DUF6318 family protein [Pseudarthrobacter sp. J64]
MTPEAAPAYKPADAAGRAQNVPVPVKPALADVNSKDGLEAFSRHWYAALGYAYETGDLVPVGELTGENCELCNNAMDVARGWNQDGRWLAGGAFKVLAHDLPFEAAPDGNFQSVAEVTQTELHTYQADGSEPLEPIVESSDHLLMMTTYANGRWTVNDVANVSN